MFSRGATSLCPSRLATARSPAVASLRAEHLFWESRVRRLHTISSLAKLMLEDHRLDDGTTGFGTHAGIHVAIFPFKDTSVWTGGGGGVEQETRTGVV